MRKKTRNSLEVGADKGLYALLNVASVACLLAASGGVHAQDAAPATATADKALPEVRVTDDATRNTEGTYTARRVDIGKTGQSPIELPQSISVITRQQLDDRNFTKLEDAIKFVTGINVTRFDGAGNYNTIQSRGFDIGAIQLDGIPLPQGANFATAFDAAIYDRVEVLRGPAGVLQGAGEPGGAISLVRKRASGPLSIGAQVQAGSFDFRRAEVDLNAPLNAAGSLRGRVVLVADDRNSFVDVLYNHKRLGYGTLELDIGPDTTASVGYTTQDIHSVVDQGLPAFANGALAAVPRSAFAGLQTNKADMASVDRFLEVEHRLGSGGSVKLTLRDTDRDSFYRSARANSVLAPNGTFTMESVDNFQKLRDQNVDLYLNLPFEWNGLKHRLLLGVAKNENETYGGNFAFGASRQFNLYQPDYTLPYPVIALPGYTSITTRNEKALYGQLQYAITDHFKLLTGGRLSWPEIEVRSTTSGAVTSSSKPGRTFTPSVAGIYELGSGLSAYASYAESFVVQTVLDSSNQLLPPRTSKQIELGLKGEFANKRLQASAALFRIEDIDRAIADPVVSTASIPGGEVRSQGLEIEISGQPQPGWDVLAGYAYTDTTYVRAPVAQQGQVFSTVTPKHSLNLYSRYAFRDGALRGWSVGGGLSWRSQFFSQSGTVQIVSGNYALANAQVTWQINDQLNLSFGVDNLFDKTYYEKVSSTSRQNFYGEPRRYVVALKAKY